MFRSSAHQLCCSTTSLWVELSYWILALYRILVRSKKWYHRLLWHFLDMFLPITEVCTDSLGHYPKYSEMKGKCKLPICKGIPKLKYEKCQVSLCFTTTSNCFRQFHLLC